MRREFLLVSWSPNVLPLNASTRQIVRRDMDLFDLCDILQYV